MITKTKTKVMMTTTVMSVEIRGMFFINVLYYTDVLQYSTLLPDYCDKRKGNEGRGLRHRHVLSPRYEER